MPLYEYECEVCGRRFEVIQRFSDPPVEQCTTCGGTVRKLLSSPAIQFKGSGWYITDYARKGSGTSGGSSDSSSSPGSSSKDSGTSGSGGAATESTGAAKKTE